MTKIIRLNRQKEAIEAALHALQELPVKQIVVCAEFADRLEEVMFYGNPTKIFQLLALAQFQIGFRYKSKNRVDYCTVFFSNNQREIQSKLPNLAVGF